MVTTIIQSSDQTVVLHNISWDLYESLVLADPDRSVPRLTYDGGELEIMSPSSWHELLKCKVAHFVNVIGEEMGINLQGYGSTTFRRKELKRGFEPDVCFYIENLARVRGKDEIDLRVDPAPDLVIEIDVRSSSLNRLSIMEAVGVPEVWHYAKNQWRILGLDQGAYREQQSSRWFPPLTPQIISTLLEESRKLEPLAWTRYLRDFIRTI